MRRYLFNSAAVVVLLFVWEKAASISPDLNFFISRPSACFEFAFSHLESLFVSTLITATEAVTGFVLALILSMVFMFICLYWPKIMKVVLPIFVSSQILPMITLSPLFIILFGMGLLSKIAMVVLMCFFPIFINLAAGVAAIPQNILDLLYLYNTGRTFRIFRILVPLSLPQGFVGLRVSTTMAIMGAVVAEFMGARDGLGKNLYLAPKSSQPQLMVCSTVLIILLGFAFYKLITTLEISICKWHNPPEKSPS